MAAQDRVVGTVHLAHATSAEQLLNPVRTEREADHDAISEAKLLTDAGCRL